MKFTPGDQASSLATIGDGILINIPFKAALTPPEWRMPLDYVAL